MFVEGVKRPSFHTQFLDCFKRANSEVHYTLKCEHTYARKNIKYSAQKYAVFNTPHIYNFRKILLYLKYVCNIYLNQYKSNLLDIHPFTNGKNKNIMQHCKEKSSMSFLIVILPQASSEASGD